MSFSIASSSWFNRPITCLRDWICLESKFNRFSEFFADFDVSCNNLLVCSISANASLR